MKTFPAFRGFYLSLLLFLPIWVSQPDSMAQSAAALKYPAAAHTPATQPGWERYLTSPDLSGPKDEAQGGRTAAGTVITPRIEDCFPAEPRNLFWQVDQVASGPGGELVPINYDVDGDGKISDTERNAIRGQNTWILWGEGNETFWGWLQEKGYGIADFLILLDSRERLHRFRTAGLMNQPGMIANSKRNQLGLYLDAADGDKILLTQPKNDIDPETNQLFKPVKRPDDALHKKPLFVAGDQQLYDSVIQSLPKDGVDPEVYGYPSGVVGLRLMPNPDFFGSGDAASKARTYWTKRVVEAPHDAYYTDAAVYNDPALVRPFRVSMSCAFCHIGPHPLNPPSNVEAPEWSNMSSVIGNQYWAPDRAFANLSKPNNFLFHFLKSQQPGTIDTSLVSTDWINNANTINAIFCFPAREKRATNNATELQGPSNMLMPSVEAPIPGVQQRPVPRVLVDGADSIGAFGALMRVYLNIGTFSEEWGRCQNPIIGYTPQRPFSIATLEANSVYWRTAERYRIPYLYEFFRHQVRKPPPPTGTHLGNALPAGNNPAPLPGTQPPGGAQEKPEAIPTPVPVANEVTAPMKLWHTPNREGWNRIYKKRDKVVRGRTVFLENCAICHSSKQPAGYLLDFSRQWKDSPALKRGEAPHLVAPMDFADWTAFKATGSYQEYVRQIKKMAGVLRAQDVGQDDPFVTDNFLANEVRIPITLVGTNSGRSVGTNGMRGQIWDNFTSETYKSLPAVGDVHFYNPFSGVTVEPPLMNDMYAPPGGGPGYYRPASLVSLWATAPYFHNNSLGLYNGNPSVDARLEAFDDGINKLLNQSLRKPDKHPVFGDLRWDNREFAKGDPGFIYRTTQVTSIIIPGKFINQLLTGVLGPFKVSLLTHWLWIVLAIVLAVLTLTAIPRLVGFVFFLLALFSGVLISVVKLYLVYGWVLLLPLVFLGVTLYFWLKPVAPVDANATVSWRSVLSLARVSMAVLFILSLLAGSWVRAFVAGDKGQLALGPLPKGTPVNLIMNLNPEAPVGQQIAAFGALTRGILLAKPLIDKGQQLEALRVFEREAGQALLDASKCPDFVLDRGHWFGEALQPEEKTDLIAFLETL